MSKGPVKKRQGQAFKVILKEPVNPVKILLFKKELKNKIRGIKEHNLELLFPPDHLA